MLIWYLIGVLMCILVIWFNRESITTIVDLIVGFLMCLSSWFGVVIWICVIVNIALDNIDLNKPRKFPWLKDKEK